MSHAFVDVDLDPQERWIYQPTCTEHVPEWRGPMTYDADLAHQNANLHDTDVHGSGL